VFPPPGIVAAAAAPPFPGIRFDKVFMKVLITYIVILKF
jgi:hypothetical protein